MAGKKGDSVDAEEEEGEVLADVGVAEVAADKYWAEMRVDAADAVFVS